MALVDKWVNKADGVDDVLADDINTIADEVIQTQQNMPTKVSDLENDAGYLTEHQDISGKADITYVDEELAKKQDKELIWKKLDTITLTEDVSALNYTLPDNCYGVIAQVELKKDISYGGGYLYIRSSGTGWVASVYSGGLSATNNDKEIRVVAYPQNGYYQSYGAIKNGSNNTTWTRYEPSMTHFMSTKTDNPLVSVHSQSKMYTGSIITIWGLIKE